VKYCLVLLMLFSHHVLAISWPEIAFPQNAQVDIVADNMLSHGYPLRTWVVKDKVSQMMMASFFRDQWEKKSQRFDARMFNGDYVINSLQPPFLLTARIHKESDGVITYLGVTNIIDEKTRAKNNKAFFPKIQGAEIISDIQSQDLFKQGRTLIMLTKSNLSSSYHYYRNYYQKRGWVENSAIIDRQAGKAVLQMSQGTDLVDISFNREKSRVYIVANQIMEGL
jgi:hypothetical protein